MELVQLAKLYGSKNINEGEYEPVYQPGKKIFIQYGLMCHP